MLTQLECSGTQANMLIGTPWRCTYLSKASLVIRVTIMQCTTLTCLKRPNILLPAVILAATGNCLICSNFMLQVTKIHFHFILYFLRDIY